MPPFAYTVRANIPDPALAERYVAWLTGGHVDAVLAGGAESAQIVRLDATPECAVFEVRYRFPSREAFDRYEAEHAPALRAEGGRLFGPDTGIVMERSFGAIIATSPA